MEYLGRAINVASRLQAQTKDLRGGPSYKALFSRNSFNSPAPPPRDIAVESTKVSLRNISPSTIECFIFQTLQVPPEKQGTSRQPRMETASKLPKPALATAAPANAAPQEPKTAITPSAHIRVAELRPIRISPISELGKWTWHDEGQQGAVIQFKNEVQKDSGTNKNAVARALLIYRADGKEILRIKGSWLDGHDQAKLNSNDTRGLIAGVSRDDGFYVLETVRTNAAGRERVEIRPSRFAPVPPNLSVLVQLTDAKGRDLLYEGEFAISLNPLTIVPLQ